MLPIYLIGVFFSKTPSEVLPTFDELKIILSVSLLEFIATYIPFVFIGWVGSYSIYDNEKNIYAANGALYGISIFTVIFWLFFGSLSMVGLTEPGTYGQLSGYLLFIAPTMGFASALIGALIGFIYGFFRYKGRYRPRRKRRTTKTRSRTN